MVVATLNVTGTLTQPVQYQLVAMCKNGTGPDACQSDLSVPFTVTITSPPTPVVRVKDSKTGTFLSSTATYTPGTGGATLKVNYTGGNPALNRQFSLDGITYQSDSLFRNLKDSTYTLYLRERSGDQGQVCQAASKEAMVFCDTVGACEISILSKDENGKLTEVMARGTNNELRPITLSVLMGSGKPLSSTTKYEWTGPGNFKATTATVLAKFIGTYLVQIKHGNIVCIDSVRLTAGPCGNAVPVSSCGSNGNFTAVPDEVSNRLTSLIIRDKIQAGDFEITATGITSGGPGGWNGRGYTSIPYMNTVVAVELKNAVVNSCYQLTMGNALPGTPTVESVYDTNWGEWPRFG